MAKIMASEKWILAVKELHLGYCKETFRAGAVIELDETNGRLIIDGRRFNDTRDLDVLKRQSENNPDNPWIISFSEEVRKDILNAAYPRIIHKRKKINPDQVMHVIKSDQDLNEEIDISDTKISKINSESKQAERDKVKTHGMKIIRGDESVEDRLAALRGKTDISSIAERARIKASGSVRMPVVQDDNLGAGFTGKSSLSMNAGQHIPSREEAEAKKDHAMAMASSRKKEAERIRVNVKGDENSDIVQEDTGNKSVEAALIEENTALRTRLDRLEKLMVASQGAKPKRGRKVGK